MSVDTKLVDMPTLTSVADDDLFYLVDVSDPTDSAEGTSVTAQVQNLPFVHKTSPVLGGNMNCQDFELQSYALAETTTFSEPSANTVRFDVSSGGIFFLDLDDSELTGNVTIDFTGYHATGKLHQWTVEIQQQTSGSRTVAWPAEVTWPDGTAPTMSTGADAIDVFQFYTRDGGTTVRGTFAQNFS